MPPTKLVLFVCLFVLDLRSSSTPIFYHSTLKYIIISSIISIFYLGVLNSLPHYR